MRADEVINFETIHANKITEHYRDELYKIIHDNGIKIIDYPSGNKVVKKISEKHFEHQKPFDENKNSFQDAIMWESIVEYCIDGDYDTVVFISNNHKDFGNKDNTAIHEELENDIPGILYYCNVQEFLDNEIEYLKDYFNDHFELEQNLMDKLKIHLASEDGISDTVDYKLINHQFDGEYFTGWGTDGYIEKIDVTVEDVTMDIENRSLLISCSVYLDVYFSIEIVNPVHESGDPGDGMISESNSTKIFLYCNITYLPDEEKFIDYVEIDSGFK